MAWPARTALTQFAILLQCPTSQGGTKRGAQTFLAGEAHKLARTEPPESAAPTQQQAQKVRTGGR